MNFSDVDKQAIINEQARILTKVTLVSTGEVFTEDDSLSNWEYEDFRYVPNQGFIGQFVERLMDVTLKGVEANSTLVDQEINVQLGVDNKNTETLTYYDMGNFIVTKVGDTDTSGNVVVESSDYTKKFNTEYNSENSKFPILAGHLVNNICDEVGVEFGDNHPAVYYIHNDDTPLDIGTYSLKSNDKIYTFTTTSVLNKYDVLSVNLTTNTVTQKIVDQSTYEITRSVLTSSTADVTYLDGIDRVIDNTDGNKKVNNVEIYGRLVQSDGDLSDIETISGTVTLSIGTNTVDISLGDEELCSMPDNVLYDTENVFYNDVDNEADLVIYDNYARDILTIDGITGVVEKIAYIGKIDSYDGEEITAPYVSSTGSLTTGATVYYLLDEPIVVSIGMITIPSVPADEITISNSEDTEMLIEYITFDDEPYSLGIELDGFICEYGEFTNNDFVVEEWPYTQSNTARQIMSDIGKLAYSWVRVGEDNKVHIDFSQKSVSDIDEYDYITTDDYYELTTEPKYIGPVNRVIIDVSEDVDGEEVYKDAPDITSEINEITIMSSPLTNTDELRTLALDGCEKLFGLTYIPLNVTTIGHPWLKADELIKVQKLDDDVVYTYPFDRVLSYQGFIKSTITSKGKNKVQTAYEFKSDVLTDIRNAEINVKKAQGQIELLTSEVYPNGTESESAIEMNSTAIVLKTKNDGALVTAELAADPSTGSAFTVKADDISLYGKNMDFTADNMSLSSTNFSVTSDGTITATGGNIAGWEMRKDANNVRWLGTTIGSANATYFLSSDGKTAYYDGVGNKNWFMYFKSRFGVDTDGKVYATNVDISGKITSSDATITGGSINLVGTDAASKFSISNSSDNTWYTNYYPNRIQIYREGQQTIQISGVSNIPNVNLFATDGSGKSTMISAISILTPRITSGNIDCGSGSCSSSGYSQVNFNKTFASEPKVVCTPNTSTNGVIAIKIRNVTTTGFEATIGGSGFSTQDFDWIAIS